MRVLPVAVLATGVLALASPAALAGTANLPSARGVEPIVTPAGGSDPVAECAALTDRADVDALQLPGGADGFPTGTPYRDGTISVTIANWDASTRSFDWSADLPVLGVWVNGSGTEGNWYDYAAFTDRGPAAGVDHDASLHTEPASGAPAPLSHVTICYAPPAPGLGLTQTSSAPSSLSRGGTFSYTIVVTNDGAAAARHVHVHDQIAVGLHVIHLLPTFEDGSCTAASSIDSRGFQRYSVDCIRKTLDPAASATATIDVLVADDAPCGDLTNLATVEAANDPPGGNAGAQRSTVTDHLPCLSSIAFAERAPSYARHGQTLTYTFRVRNDGETRLGHVSVSARSCDMPPHKITDGNGDRYLSPGERWVFACRGEVRASGGAVRSGASVSAVGPHGLAVSATDRHRIRVVHPAIRLVQRVSPTSGTPGATVVYRYVVTNRGDTPLRHVRVVDAATGVIGVAPHLAPGATRTFERSVVLSSRRAQVTSVARATARDLTGRTVRDSSTASVTVVSGGSAADGTAFTGPDVGRPLLASVVLALLGLTASALARPRRRV